MWHDAYAMNGPCGEMDFDPEFKNTSLLEQLGKIIDSESAREVVDAERFNPVDTVTTDDGDVIKVTAEEAEVIRNAVLNVSAQKRLETIKNLQTTKGLTEVLKTVRML
jgi:hypothetical protein